MDSNILNITNGDSAANVMAQAGVVGEILPWRDGLHEGPVPENLSLAELSVRRADYLSGAFSLSKEQVLADMQARDEKVSRIADYDRVVLWFEHDLYDQLQLLQILDCLASQSVDTPLSMICIGEFAGVEPFHGLGVLNPVQMAQLIGTDKPITPAQLDLGRAGWQAVRSADPAALTEYLAQDLTPLPFMRAAMIRFLQEYPSRENGLGRTEQQALEILQAGPHAPYDLFERNQEMEEARYLGDWGFWTVIQRFVTGNQPLIKTVSGDPFFFSPTPRPGEAFVRQLLELTEIGRNVLACELDRMDVCPADYWLGGVKLGQGADWRFDPASTAVKQRV